MSKRYVIQVLTAVVDKDAANWDEAAASGKMEWLPVQHPAGGDWKTRSRSTAIVDAAKLKHEGETRELRVMESRPVFELVEVGIDNDKIMEAHEAINWVDDDDDDDDEEDDDEGPEDMPQFELVKE